MTRKKRSPLALAARKRASRSKVKPAARPAVSSIPPATVELLHKASVALRLKTIYLGEALLERPFPLPSHEGLEVLRQTKRSVNFNIVDSKEGQRVLVTRVRLGVRLADPKLADKRIYALIEAEFIAEYGVQADVSDDAVLAFANLNSVHNIWPFWRQHVFDVVQRANLPAIEVPLFAAIRSD